MCVCVCVCVQFDVHLCTYVYNNTCLLFVMINNVRIVKFHVLWLLAGDHNTHTHMHTHTHRLKVKTEVKYFVLSQQQRVFSIVLINIANHQHYMKLS